MNLSDYIEKSFAEYQKFYEANVHLEKTTTLPILTLTKLDNYDFPLKENSSNALQIKFYTLNKVSSQLEAKSKIGSLAVYYENQLLCSLNILLENELLQNSWHYYFVNILKKFSF